MTRADAYWHIPPGYAEFLGGLRWSHGCDAIEAADGSALVFAAELELVLDGAFAPAGPPFGYVLTVLHALRGGAPGGPLERLRTARAAAHAGVGVGRNVGRLVAELCRDLPPDPNGRSADAVRNALLQRQRYGERHRPDQTVAPPFRPAAFERHLAGRLTLYSDDDLAHWLRHGAGPTPAGKPLAEPLESLPVRVAKVLAEARRRLRLAGAVSLAPTVDAALTLPPRRPTSDRLPQGGYADVTTRGDPARLLPSQFALDPDDFVRRFAERELLYFEREQPHAARTTERVVVLDQGVRTWGGVRLGLTAAVLALLNKDARRFGAVRVVVTSTAGPLDVRLEPGAVADVLEASDLHPHPGGRLADVLAEDHGTDPRDIILLTHPRNLREPAVVAAAATRGPADRLFALTVDDDGRAELGEWTPGGPVAVRSFRVDLVAAEAVKPATLPRKTAAGSFAAWAGDVEPVPFPFRPGLVGEPTGFAFDADGEWLVVAGPGGRLHALACDGSPPEVLPRAFADGVVLKTVDGLVGVAGGVVVGGRMTLPQTSDFGFPPGDPGDRTAFVAAHYDRAARRVRLHVFTAVVGGPAVWRAFPDLHCVSVQPEAGQVGAPGCAFDLETGGRHPGGDAAGLTTRARLAWARAENGEWSPKSLTVLAGRMYDKPYSLGPFLRLVGNNLSVERALPPWLPFEPTEEGKPMLAGRGIEGAELAGDVLAVALFKPPGKPGGQRLVLFRRADGAALGEAADSYRNAPFALSADGRRLARGRGRRGVVVTETAGGPSLAVAARAGLHDTFDVRLAVAPFRLKVHAGRFTHTFSLTDGDITHAREPAAPRRPRPALPPRPPLPADYDPDRFPLWAVATDGTLWAVADRLGQVLLMSEARGLVAAFVVRRERAAAWEPGGAFWGDLALIGGPPTPGAAAVIGRAITDARG